MAVIPDCPSVDCVETRTTEKYAPDCSQLDHPMLIAELKRKDPGFVAVQGVQMIGDGNRRARDGWLFSRVTYVRQD